MFDIKDGHGTTRDSMSGAISFLTNATLSNTTMAMFGAMLSDESIAISYVSTVYEMLHVGAYPSLCSCQKG